MTASEFNRVRGDDMSFWTKLRRTAGAFRTANGGNIAITFALATLPVVGTVGFAVDYSHANSVKAAMQAALDSTALMLAKDAATVTSAQLQTNATNYFNALFTRPEATSVAVTATYTATGGSKVVVNGTANVPTAFLGIIGYNTIPVTGSSTTAWGSTRLRVALALDTTGSMADDGKIAALKSSTKALLAQLKAAAGTDGDVYVSIVPFSKDVNVGRANYNGNWIDWDDWELANGSYQNTSNCSGSSRRGRSRCSGSSQVWVPAAYSTWNGCITDRDQNYDQLVTAPNPADSTLPAASASTLFPAEQFDGCPAAMMGLNYNWTAMNTLVDGLYPAGNTNQPIGLVWAWQSLVGGGPLTAPAKDANYKYTDVIILMSDGLNTENRFSTSQTTIDKRMYDSSNNGAGTCANIKNAGVTLYTVQVNTGGDPLSTLLQNCAGSPEKFSDITKFFQVTTASGLGTVFNTIGTNLTQLRVAK
jgi:Flp pilus assembly protein TadG